MPSRNHTVHGLVQWSWSKRGMGAWCSALTSGNWTIRPSRMPTHYPTLMRPQQPAWFSVVLFTWPKVWVLAVWDGWGEQPLTTLTVGPLGIYKCDRMPFRLTNTPATFQWLMETYLRDLNLNWYIIYLYAIVIFSKDPTSHLKVLEAVFQKLEQARLKLKPSKCEPFHRQITYLGHIVSAQGIVTDEGKRDAIRKWPTPTTITEVQSFLGFMGYYCWFIPKLVQVA